MVLHDMESARSLIVARSEVDSRTGCWEWKKYRQRGYGKININGRVRYAHRVSWWAHFGEIVYGFHVLHRCDNPRCVNPNHLYLGTDADNARDCVARGRKRPAVGERVGLAKISDADSVSIRKMAASGEISNRGIAKLFGVSHTAIDYVVNGRTFKHTIGRQA